MKIKITGIVCILLLIGAGVCAHARANNQPRPFIATSLASGISGRYQVITAEIDLTSTGGALKHKTAIRIDTQTGQTWELVEIQDKVGVGDLTWVPLHEIK